MGSPRLSASNLAIHNNPAHESGRGSNKVAHMGG
nr:MAG TPA: hypothetical protein [Caudoviricetes sp.]